MEVTVDIEIRESKEAVWAAITDIENCSDMIAGIVGINILECPEDGFVGLKWEETRQMFGKEAVETIWITDSVDNQYYCTRAESHGSVYISTLSLSEIGAYTLLTMSFSGVPQTISAKIMSFCCGLLFRKTIKAALLKDLEDIKHYVENR